MPSKCYLSFSPVHPSSLCPAFSSFLFATVYHALNSQNDLPGTPFASGCSVDHKSQMTSHHQVQSPLYLPSRTLSDWLHLLSMLHRLLLRTRTFWLWAAIQAGMFLSALLPLSHPPGMPFLALHPWTCPLLLCGSLSSLISNFTVSSGHFLCLYLFLINVTVYSSKTDQSPSLDQQ